MVTEAQRGKALLAALVNYVLWGGWLGFSSRFHTIERIGPPLFWTLPVVAGGVAWTLVSTRARHRVPIYRLVLGTAAGLVATAVGVPLAIVAGTLFAFAAFWPLTVIALVLEILLLFSGFALMYACCGTALRVLANEPWTQ
jgi:hypothetical protein